MTDKVIEFPKHKVVREIPEEVHKERQAKADQKLADSIVDEISGLIITELDNYLVEVTDKQFARDFVLVSDSLRAAVYRAFGIDHHLHEYVDENIRILEGNPLEMTDEELKVKIEALMKDLTKAKEKLDNTEEE